MYEINNKQTPLLADIKKSHDKYNANNLEYKKINNNKTFFKTKFINSNNKSGATATTNNNNFDKNYNKLVQQDKSNYNNTSNFANKTNIDTTSIKNLSLKNGNLLNYGVNFFNAKNDSKNLCLNIKDENTNSNINKSNILTKKRPASSNNKLIIKENKIEDLNYDNYRKIDVSNKNAINKGSSNNKNKSSGNSISKITKESTLFWPNVESIIKCLKFIKFPKNYIDYYKIVMDKVHHSKNNKFLISVFEEKRHLVNNFYLLFFILF